MNTISFPCLHFEDAASALTEAHQDGLLIFGCGGFARDLKTALMSLGITVRGFIVSNREATHFVGCPVAPLNARPSGWTDLPLWTSCTLIADILSYRLGHIRGISSAPAADPQYFPDVLTCKIHTPLSFVDAGAYDGDTQAAAQNHIPLREAWAFEPDLTSFPLLAERVQDLNDPVTCLPCGLSAVNASFAFSGGHGEGSTLSREGDCHIPALRLDDGLPNAHAVT